MFPTIYERPKRQQTADQSRQNLSQIFEINGPLPQKCTKPPKGGFAGHGSVRRPCITAADLDLKRGYLCRGQRRAVDHEGP